MMTDIEGQIRELKAHLVELQLQRKYLDEKFIQLFKSAYQNSVDKEPDMESPVKIIAKHIKSLKTYNELRDVGLKLAQCVADEKNVSIGQIFEEIGISMKDE
ncbi:uncharacterized protein GVI51_F02981 [Nakaseomyces glabratus]|uniref:Uncharacterized protein n=2 Tax=Candida glabrata TaxID=5478 RepID=B4UMZ7_CANGA|nr:uncharacterized protein CAGL0F03261g [Nakaseomyces glabratus]KAH7587605.1 Swi5 [Nakaseomyces glabratus]KAH7604088.1 Swi5 [Nakaseomyces glabratus]KAH7605073.1 Swi5 [Nakaseomyces glabratus]KAH7607389.1 Swi5 [Nakaseomyces glabratus]KAH7614081.1 Swi5 [Nakaseomyces glabratus]|eukprot:XP_002999539.1 uncharacterized protein CAGL0F03261g [[Candida] glabrata]